MYGGYSYGPGRDGPPIWRPPEPVQPEVEETEEKPTATYLWRVEQFNLLGFRSPYTEMLASSKNADLGVARDLIKKGCGHEDAFRILV